MAPRITVLVCAWNRADGIRRIVEALAEQSISHSDFELVVVDNNSADGTRELVAEMIPRVPFSLRCILEDRQGKCWALNTGIAAANGRVVACLDDDCMPAPDWLETIDECFTDDRLSILGGPCISRFSERVKSDPHLRFLGERFLGSFEPYEELTEIREENPPMGMNLAFTKEVAERVGGFDVALGPRPGRHIGREETAFIRGAQVLGFRVFYSPRMVVFHHIDDARVSWASIKRQGYYSGIGSSREKYGVRGSTPVLRKLGLGAMFGVEAVYSALRITVYVGNRRKRTVSAFRLHAALGKLAGLWSRE